MAAVIGRDTSETKTREWACVEEDNIPPDGFVAVSLLKKSTTDKFASLRTSQSEVDQAAGTGHVKIVTLEWANSLGLHGFERLM
ncbi:unnamed protein product, partial [Pylaiella littoralis]